MNRQQPRIPATCPPGFTNRYTVVSGDTMFNIARRYNISVEALAAANPHITDANVIYPGDVLCVPGPPVVTPGDTITLATTTSTVDTGLLDFLIPRFEAQTGFGVNVVAVGSGRALEMGGNGEADALLTHAPEAERIVVRSGLVTNYKRVMHNDFIIVGPPADPAGIRGSQSAADAFGIIAQKQSPFISRGDNSGTNLRELQIWSGLGINPTGAWYSSTGTGMAETLLAASDAGAYTLTDRGTYLAMRRNINLAVMVVGDPKLLNIYHVMQVNPQKFPNVNAAGGRAFVEFMISPETQTIIGEFGRTVYGQPLFVPNALTCK